MSATKNRLLGASLGTGSKPSHNSEKVYFPYQGKVGFKCIFLILARFCLNTTHWGKSGNLEEVFQITRVILAFSSCYENVLLIPKSNAWLTCLHKLFILLIN